MAAPVGSAASILAVCGVDFASKRHRSFIKLLAIAGQVDLVPGSPGPVELPDVGQPIMLQGGGVPAGAQSGADKPKESRLATHLDQEFRDGIALSIKRHEILGIFFDLKELSERHLAATGQQVDGDLVMALALALVFAQQ